MIVVEGTLWPVIVIGEVDDAPREAFIVPDELLEMSHALAIGVVVAGTGDVGMRLQHAALHWLEDHRDLLTARALRLAWVIEDERIRACTNAWLRCMGQTLFTVQSVAFRTLQSALPWLLEAPWQVEPALDSRDRTVRLEASDGSRRKMQLVSRSR